MSITCRQRCDIIPHFGAPRYLQYVDILVVMCITSVIIVSIAVSVRLPDEVVHELEDLASVIERSKTYIICKAVESYLDEYADYLVALERLRDKDDDIISNEKMRKRLDL